MEHIGYYLRLLAESRQLGFEVRDVRVVLIPLSPAVVDLVEQRILHELSARKTGAAFELDRDPDSGGDYYHAVRFQIRAADPSSSEYLLVDGGLTSWTQQLLNNHKEFCLASGMGTERFIFCFRHRDDPKAQARQPLA